MTSPVFTADPGPAVEAQVAGDMVRRMLPVLPVLVLIAGLIWGPDGAASGAFAVVLVLANLALSAALLGWAARISLALLMGAALGGFALRLFLLAAVVWLVKDQAWVDITALGITLVVTHLGLLIWETRHVSASLAYPGLKPTPSKPVAVARFAPLRRVASIVGPETDVAACGGAERSPAADHEQGGRR